MVHVLGPERVAGSDPRRVPVDAAASSFAGRSRGSVRSISARGSRSWSAAWLGRRRKRRALCSGRMWAALPRDACERVRHAARHRVPRDGTASASLLARVPSGRASEDLLVRQVSEAASAGVDLVQIREPNLETRELCRLVERCLEAAAGLPARIVVNDRADVALVAGAHGVHLRADSYAAGSGAGHRAVRIHRRSIGARPGRGRGRDERGRPGLHHLRHRVRIRVEGRQGTRRRGSKGSWLRLRPRGRCLCWRSAASRHDQRRQSGPPVRQGVAAHRRLPARRGWRGADACRDRASPPLGV